MAKNVELLLLHTVENLGIVGDIVKVKPGYGRNFLIPQGKAALATPANIKAMEARRAELEKAAAEELTAAKKRFEGINGTELVNVDGLSGLALSIFRLQNFEH